MTSSNTIITLLNTDKQIFYRLQDILQTIELSINLQYLEAQKLSTETSNLKIKLETLPSSHIKNNALTLITIIRLNLGTYFRRRHLPQRQR